MNGTPTRDALRAAVEAAVAAVRAAGLPVTSFRGIALHDSRRDGVFTALDAFERAVAAISIEPLVDTRFGPKEGHRLVLQFIYEYFNRVADPVVAVDVAIFDAVWDAFTRELADPDWTYRGVANMRHFAAHEPSAVTSLFSADPEHIDLPDGVTIRRRQITDLALGFDRLITELADDWRESGFGHSSFAMVVEQKIPKTPKSVVAVTAPDLWLKVQRAIGALRLVAPGDIGIGSMWIVRSAQFQVGPGIGGRVGFSIPDVGFQFAPYVWRPELSPAVRDVYSDLRWLEVNGYDKAPGNLDLALRSFMSTYDRWPRAPDSQLLDSITALEAILGSGTEITFKLAFRLASLLAKDDAERGALLYDIKGFYDTRSALVHGGRLKEKHQARLARVDELRSLVRRVLRALVRFAVRGAGTYTKEFLQAHLDAALVDATEREKLRRALGLA